MKTIDECLSESIANYKRLTARIVELNETIESLSPDEILQRCASIRELQETIAGYDGNVHEIMDFIGHEILENPLVGEYQRALDAAIREAGIIESRALLRKSLLLQEIAKGQMYQKENSGYDTVITTTYNPLLH